MGLFCQRENESDNYYKLKGDEHMNVNPKRESLRVILCVLIPITIIYLTPFLLFLIHDYMNNETLSEPEYFVVFKPGMGINKSLINSTITNISMAFNSSIEIKDIFFFNYSAVSAKVGAAVIAIHSDEIQIILTTIRNNPYVLTVYKTHNEMEF